LRTRWTKLVSQTIGGNAGQHIAQVGFGGEAVDEVDALEQGLDGGGAVAAGIGAGKQPILRTSGRSAGRRTGTEGHLAERIGQLLPWNWQPWEAEAA